MELPDEIMKKLKEAILAKMGGHSHRSGCFEGKCDCQQLIVLKPEDKLKLRTVMADADKLKRKGNLLYMEADALKAKHKALLSRMWEHIYKTYSLNSDGDYHWSRDGRIFQRKESHDIQGGIIDLGKLMDGESE